MVIRDLQPFQQCQAFALLSTFHGKVNENAIKQNEKLQNAEKWYLQPASWDFYSRRSNRRGAFYKKGVLNSFEKFTGKQPCWSLFLLKMQF